MFGSENGEAGLYLQCLGVTLLPWLIASSSNTLLHMHCMMKHLYTEQLQITSQSNLSNMSLSLKTITALFTALFSTVYLARIWDVLPRWDKGAMYCNVLVSVVGGRMRSRAANGIRVTISHITHQRGPLNWLKLTPMSVPMAIRWLLSWN